MSHSEDLRYSFSTKIEHERVKQLINSIDLFISLVEEQVRVRRDDARLVIQRIHSRIIELVPLVGKRMLASCNVVARVRCATVIGNTDEIVRRDRF